MRQENDSKGTRGSAATAGRGQKPSTSFRIALDGPSALVLYRDRDEAKLQAWQTGVVQPPQRTRKKAGQRAATAANLPRTALQSFDPDDFSTDDLGLMNEDVAAELADSNVFGHRPTSQLYTEVEAAAGLPPFARTQMRSCRRCATTSRLLKRIDFHGIGLRPPSETSPLFLLAPDTRARRAVRNVRQRACTSELPSSSLRCLGKNVLVPSPELTFLLLARHLSLIELIEVGMELCGHYRMAGATTLAPLLSQRTIYSCDALTTPKRLQSFLERVGTFPGKALAQRALKHVVPDSSSPMETIIFLLLCLPRNLGGYALPRPVLNAKRAVNTLAESFTLSQSLIPDLYWAEGPLDMEYDSDEFHADPESLIKGARRTLALRAMHVDVISMTYDMVCDERAFDATARLVARHIGARMQTEADRMRVKRLGLRSSLFCGVAPIRGC